ncbi:MAG: phosphotransacetylase [Gammaproteobacteria bacterium]|nr:phosphotransacetylase [Gammaproteobacteria bacterium]
MESIVDDLAAGLRSRSSHTLVLPEGTDERVLAAARLLSDEKMAHIILPGEPDAIRAAADRANVSLHDLLLVDPSIDDHLDAYVTAYLEMRPGANERVARRLISRPLFFAGSMLRASHADALVAGAVNTTAKVIEACLMTIGKADGISTPSSCFLMLIPASDGKTTPLIFADCAVNVEPTSAELADIAIASATTARFLLDESPRVALLSFSSKGSGKHRSAARIAEAAALAAERDTSIAIDGELQADTALSELVARIKVDPQGEVAGRANVLVFPDLNSGNIAYKLTQQLAGASAIGPLLQGFACPVADLSRGASVSEIVDTAIVTLARVTGRR